MKNDIEQYRGLCLEMIKDIEDVKFMSQIYTILIRRKRRRGQVDNERKRNEC